jgi:hypothetical protein
MIPTKLNRLKKMRQHLASRGSVACSECGLDPTLPGEVVFSDEDEEPSASPPCPACGEREYVTIVFDDAQPYREETVK